MKHDNFYESDIFNNFANILEGQGQLQKKASYILPESQVIGTAQPDMIEMDLSKLAGDSRSGIYDVSHDDSNESLVQHAHPGGGLVVEKAPDDLGKAETILESSKKHEDMARREPTGKYAALAESLSKLADNFDKVGLTTMAISMDTLLEKVAMGMEPAMPGKPAPSTPPAFEPSQPQEPMTNAEIAAEEARKLREKYPNQVKEQAADDPMSPMGDPKRPQLPESMKPADPGSPPTAGDLSAEHAELMREKYPNQVRPR